MREMLNGDLPRQPGAGDEVLKHQTSTRKNAEALTAAADTRINRAQRDELLKVQAEGDFRGSPGARTRSSKCCIDEGTIFDLREPQTFTDLSDAFIRLISAHRIRWAL